MRHEVLCGAGGQTGPSTSSTTSGSLTHGCATTRRRTPRRASAVLKLPSRACHCAGLVIPMWQHGRQNGMLEAVPSVCAGNASAGRAGGELVGLRIPDDGDGQQDRHRGQQHVEQHAHRHGGARHEQPGAQGLEDLPQPGCRLRVRPLWRLHRVRPFSKREPPGASVSTRRSASICCQQASIHKIKISTDVSV